MANGNDFYNLTSGQIAGARGGGENLESIIRNLYGALVDKEKFGDVGGTDIEKRESFSDFGFDWMTGEEGGFETGTWGEGTLGSRGTGEGALSQWGQGGEGFMGQFGRGTGALSNMWSNMGNWFN